MRKYFTTILILIVLASGAGSALACTDFVLKAEDGSMVNARAMEFAVALDSYAVIYPRGFVFASDAPGGKKGASWTGKYGFAAISGIGLEGVTDGMNEAGLSVGFLWLPETEYQQVPKKESAKAVDITDLGSWMLSNFSSVEEVKKSMRNIFVWGRPVPEANNMFLPLHVAVHDASGENLVIEFINGQVQIHDNPVGVLTNAPTFDWQVENLRNFVNLTSVSAQPMSISGVTLAPAGQGSGMLGVPGDWTPPSRFVRAAFFTHFADQPKTADEAVLLAQHILNTVDIPYGEAKGETPEGVEKDYTMWTVIKDLKNKVLYFRTYENLSLRAVDLKKLDLSPGSAVKSIRLCSEEKGITDVSDKLL